MSSSVVLGFLANQSVWSGVCMGSPFLVFVDVDHRRVETLTQTSRSKAYKHVFQAGSANGPQLYGSLLITKTYKNTIPSCLVLQNDPAVAPQLCAAQRPHAHRRWHKGQGSWDDAPRPRPPPCGPPAPKKKHVVHVCDANSRGQFRRVSGISQHPSTVAPGLHDSPDAATLACSGPGALGRATSSSACWGRGFEPKEGGL